MKNILLFAAVQLLAACHTPDATGHQPNTCEVHHVAMTKRSVPYAHGMIPLSQVEAGRGEWKQRMDHYPHPGDCEPATDIVLPGQTGKVLVDVCPKCEASQKAMQARKR